MNTVIDKMASDLGIYRFASENMINYKCRVIYSAMSSWIKAIAMDHPICNKENEFYGISKRHIYERGNAVLESLIKMNPEISFWFNVEKNEENPVVIIRNRLLNHGDLLNVGFDTDMTLSIPYKEHFISCYDTVYGEVLGKNIIYSGIAALSKSNIESQNDIHESPEEWLNNFLEAIWWSSMPSEMKDMMYFNPTHKSRNNYSAWDNSLPDGSIILCRIMVNKNGYEYYLLKPENKLIHKLDPFLQAQGYHIRIMYALKKLQNNSVTATIKKYDDHIKLQLYTHLPIKQQMLLDSYAWPDNRINDRLCWTMYDYIWNYIKPYFEMIGIQIMEEYYG